jgi:hypothetical protein
VKSTKVARVATATSKTVVARKSKVVDVEETPTLEVEEIGDADLAALKEELGLADSYSE